MDPNDPLTQILLDVQSGLPRQGPGDEASTLRALALCTELPPAPQVLDIGCGPGMQTLVLARALDGHIYAGDLVQAYLDQLAASAEAAGLRDRIGQLQLDMADLPFGRDTFDLIWSEGAAYILGIEEAFTQWKDPLRPRGYLAVTQLVWLTDDRPAEAVEFWADEYPDMTDVPATLAVIENAGYEVVGHFTLPDAAWWEHYYTPLEAKLPALREKYAGNEEALAIIASSAAEIDVRRRFGQTYGYEFFVARSSDPDLSPEEGDEAIPAMPPRVAPQPPMAFPPPMDD
jgi:SAM-dependent methyltransferase